MDLKALKLSELDHVFFLDLEETVIDEWDSDVVRHATCRRVRHAMREAAKDLFPGGRVLLGLMSWAVYHDKDLTAFKDRFRQELEWCLEHHFEDSLLWHMDEWCKQFGRCSVRGAVKKVSRDDLYDLCGKHEVLFAMRNHPELKSCKVTLVDDMAEHGLCVNKGNFRLNFLNVRNTHW